MGKWRLITDLSYPPGLSVNDGIDSNLCSLKYISVDRVAEVIASYQPEALLAKIDIESAYRLVPVHPLDCPLQLGGAIYMDPMMPFGLCSAPKLFNAVVDALVVPAWLRHPSCFPLSGRLHRHRPATLARVSRSAGHHRPGLFPARSRNRGTQA